MKSNQLDIENPGSLESEETSESLANELIEKAETIISSDISDDEKSRALRNMIGESVIQSVNMSMVHSSGPLPPPSILRGYEDALPGSPERIMKLVENEADHRHKMDERQLRIESRDSLLGIIFSVIITMCIMLAGCFIVAKVPDTIGAIAGALVGTTGIGSIIITMIRSTRYKNKTKPK